MSLANTNGTSGSLIVTETPPVNYDTNNQNNVVTIKLKNPTKPSVKWTEDVVDNEFLNKKSSKSLNINKNFQLQQFN